MKLYNIVVFSFFVSVILLLGACSTGGISGAFGTSAPSGSFEALPNVVTPEQARYAGIGSGEPDPRIVADMQALASHTGSGAYRIGPSDLLTIKVFQASELSGEVRVDQSGSVTLPLIGSVRLAGLSQVEAERRLAGLLGSNLLQNPQVSIFIKQFTNKRITIEGGVAKQGVFPLTGQITISQAIALAGGLSADAKSDSIALFRAESGSSRVYYIDFNLIREGRFKDPFVMNDDRILVPKRKKQRVTIEGEINKPGVLTLSEPTTILQVIASSGGLTTLGAPNRVILFRTANGTNNAYGVDLSSIRQGKDQDPFVQDGDKIVVHRSNSRYWLNQVSTLLSPINLLRAW